MSTQKPASKQKNKKQESGIEIIKASYGVTPNFTDVTDETKGLLKDGELNFTVSAQELGILDPAPGVTKTYQVQFKTNGGRPQTLVFDDGKVVLLSAPPVDEPPAPFNASYELYGMMWFFGLSVCTSFFGYSAFQLGKYGFGNEIVGYLLAILAGGSFVSFGASEVGTGILTFIFTSPLLLSIIPLTVFAYSLYDPAGINFTYPIKNVDLPTSL